MAPNRIDATQGPIVRQILMYSFPLILSTLIQQLFHAVDLAVLGNMADTTAVAAVGATSSTISLLMVLFTSISSGTRVLLARFIGERSEEKVQRTVDTAVIFAFIGGMLVLVLGWVAAPVMMGLTECPENCMDGAVLYIRVYLCAAPGILLYNFSNALLTTAGNTRSPLHYMFIGGALNIVLNIVLCLLLENKVMAVAVASAASQVLGAVLCLRRLCSGRDIVKLVPSKMKWDTTIFGKMLKQGLPISLYNALFPLATLQIQTAINSFGVAGVAGSSAASTLEAIASSFIGGIGTATGVFIGQNLGAHKPERVRSAFRNCLWMNFVIGGILGVTLYSSGRFWLGLLLPDDPAAVDYAMIRMSFVMLFYGVNAINCVLTHTLQSFGYSILSSINSVVGVLLFRVFWMRVIYPRYETYPSLMCCFLVSWLLLLIANITMSVVVLLRYRKGHYKRL
jgi:putative MATE family efflux protein